MSSRSTSRIRLDASKIKQNRRQGPGDLSKKKFEAAQASRQRQMVPKSPFVEKSGERKKRKRFKPGELAIKEIRRLQKSVEPIIPREPFNRLVRSVMNEVSEEEYRWTANALQVLHFAGEDYMVGLYEDAYLCSLHCKRVTLMSRDLALARRIRGIGDPGNH